MNKTSTLTARPNFTAVSEMVALVSSRPKTLVLLHNHALYIILRVSITAS